jgi:LPXTG-site transpeptidase (sortase) family protein
MRRATPVARQLLRAFSTACFVVGVALLIWPFFHSALSGYATGKAQAEALAAWDHEAERHARPGSPGREMVLEIPRLGLRRVVPDGATVPVLQRYGVGHISWTGFPRIETGAIPLEAVPTSEPGAGAMDENHSGTVGIAGHRTTYGAPFFRLGDLVPGDPIVLLYGGRRYVYRMERRITTVPSDSDALNAGDDHIALVTCTPAFSAAFRLIVFGRLDSVAASVAAR